MSRFSSPKHGYTLNWSQLYLGVALTALATLVLELSLTRIFSVVFYYHFAFLAISVALFGLGAGGLCSYAITGRSARLFWKLGTLSAANSVCVVASLAFVLTRGGELESGTLVLVYVMSALPFFLAGIVVSTAIAETVERVERVYFFDLMGAAAGCLLLVPMLDFVGGPNTVIGSAVLFSAASAIWYTLAGSVKGRAAAVVLALTLVVLIVYNTKHPVIDVRYAKGERLVEELFVKWNSFSRIAVAPEAEPGSMSINIDADASTGIASVDFDRLSERDRRRLLYQGPGLPYVLRPGAKTLIIGPGGGGDVARALASGSRDITGVEINPIIADTIMRERFSSASKELYFRPEVHIVVGDGRSFVRGSRQQYQVLQTTLLDTLASTAAGAFALSESSLYTTEAFGDYLSRLTEDGLMAFTRWGFDPPRESLRLVTLAVEALDQFGETEPWRHVIVVREQAGRLDEAGWRDTVLISRRPFSGADIARCRDVIREAGMQAVYLPGDVTGSPFAELLRGRDPAGYLRQYPYDVSSVSDNSPFFFYTARTSDVWDFVRNGARSGDGGNINGAVPLLLRLVGLSLLATAIMLTLPPLILGGRLPRHRGVLRFLWYFVFVGAGYLLVQVSLIQKFVLFLGHPTYALTVIIFSMLVSSGLGSYYSRRVIASSDRSLMGVLAVVALLVAALAVVISPLMAFGAGWPLVLKLAITLVLIAPVGFAMGMPFPAGLARLAQQHAPSVRWAWSLNAAASVMGSVCAIFLAIHLGLRETLLVGGVMYLCALISVQFSSPLPASRPGAAETG